MTNAKPTIAITGATGFLGSYLVDYFHELGWQVVGLARNPNKGHNKSVAYRRYDMEKPVDALLLQGVDYLVHAAFIPLDNKHPDAKILNINAAQNLAALSGKLKWRVFVSSMSAHDEAISVYGLQKLAIEKIFSEPHDTILRPGLIIGGEGIVKRMIAFMKSKHVVPIVSGGKQPLQVIAVSDLAILIRVVIEKKRPGHFIAANPKIYTYKQFYQILAGSLNTRVLLVPVPYWALMSAFQLARHLHIPLAVGEDNLKGLRQLQSVDNSHELKELGVVLMDLEAALDVQRAT